MTKILASCAAALVLMASGCNVPADEAAAPPVDDIAAVADEAPAAGQTDNGALIPPAPGEEGGLPDDPTSLAEGPIEEGSAQAAGQVVQHYGALLEQGRVADAYALWGGDGETSAEAFADSFGRYSEIHALVGAPGAIEGAAGSLYVTVPLQLYGRLAGGGTFNMIGPVTLRRANDVPGASAGQLRWRIYRSELQPRGEVREAS